MTESLLSLKGVCRHYKQGTDLVRVLEDLDLELRPGEMVALTGASGSGKSTLLHQVGLLERPDKGTIILDGTEMQALSDRKRTRNRREKLGFIYQFHHLLPEFSALENVVMTQLIAGTRKAQAVDRAKALLDTLGIGHRLNHRPGELSGGEQQRVAIARALVREPVLLLADEPTGNLDETTADKVFDALTQLIREKKTAALIATHNADLAKRMDRHLNLQHGKIEVVR